MNSIYRQVRHSGMAAIALTMFALLLGAAHLAQAQNPLKTIDNPEGGKIVYGQVDGAKSQAAAMGAVLRAVHNQCGDKPQVGKIFQVRGANSVAVFFTAVRRAQGDNKAVAGMIIAAKVSPNHVEAALVTDDAARFGSTVNPLLRQLFSVWHPGEAAPSSSAATGAKSPAPSGRPAPAVALHKVTLPDDTASVSLPAGWTVDPRSGGGTMRVYGTHGEVVTLNNMFLAQDPYSPGYRNMQRMGIKPLQGQIVYPTNVDLVKALPDIIQQFRRANGLGPAELKIDHAEQAPATEGAHCVHATGQINPDGKGMQAMYRVVCATPPQTGLYSFHDYNAIFPNAVASQENTIAGAIFASFQVNMALVTKRATAEAAPEIARLKQNYNAQQQAMLANGARIVGSINQIGANATARYNATQAANDAQHAGYWAQQDSNARNSQGFSNYLLDQTVIQDNNMYGNGTIGHGTAWNATADALVRSNPDRYEIVQTPNFWKGVDY